MRYDAIPVEDILGGSDVFRRPGNILSVDPGIMLTRGNWNFYLSVPIAVRRERPQSVTDRETGIATGNPRIGDAAFADYVLNFGFTYRFGSRNSDVIEVQEWENIP